MKLTARKMEINNSWCEYGSRKGLSPQEFIDLQTRDLEIMSEYPEDKWGEMGVEKIIADGQREFLRIRRKAYEEKHGKQMR